VKWGIFNTSHQVGTFLILAATGYLGVNYGWRSCFWGPAILGLATAAFLYWRIRDTPESLGLPPVNSSWDAEPSAERGIGLTPANESQSGGIGIELKGSDEEPLQQLVSRRVYRNPAIWLSCLSNFFVYTVRYGVLNWSAVFLTEAKKFSLTSAALITGSFELAGLVGCLLAGWVTDRFWGGRRAPACIGWMLACSVCLVAFWKTPPGDAFWATCCVSGVGFTVYGPQFLGGLMSADLAGKRAAGTAVGFHGFFGYLSGLLSGVGMSALVTKLGWDAAFGMLAGCAVLGALSFVPIWSARPVEE
jgi:OPA family glycerol-3-phosphate transporter-like MFS transporter/OPA family sugar phosphate sensor protein UhpC-like MFS transporter